MKLYQAYEFGEFEGSAIPAADSQPFVGVHPGLTSSLLTYAEGLSYGIAEPFTAPYAYVGYGDLSGLTDMLYASVSSLNSNNLKFRLYADKTDVLAQTLAFKLDAPVNLAGYQFDSVMPRLTRFNVGVAVSRDPFSAFYDVADGVDRATGDLHYSEYECSQLDDTLPENRGVAIATSAPSRLRLVSNISPVYFFSTTFLGPLQ